MVSQKVSVDLDLNGNDLLNVGAGASDAVSSVYPRFTVGADDDEFDDESFSGWTAVNDGAAIPTVTELNDVASILHPGGGSGAHLLAYMKTASVSVGDIIETAAHMQRKSQNYPIFGLLFADGTIYNAGNQVATYWSPSENLIYRAEFDGYNAAGLIGSVTPQANSIASGSDLFLRLKYVAANTWACYFSCDGVSWLTNSASFASTCTPSAFGFFVTTWGGAEQALFTFRYFRKRT